MADRRPVGVLGPGGGVVAQRDPGLDGVRTPGLVVGREQGCALGDRVAVPRRPVLLAERYDAPVAHPGRPAGVGEQHQRQQRAHLVLPGQQVDQRPGQPDRLGRDVDAQHRVARGGGVPLVEHQVEHAQDTLDALGPQLRRRDAVGDAGVLDLGPRADQPLLHRRLGDQERPGDLGGRQPAQRPQGERHPRRHRQRRVAAGEDQAQPLVGDVLGVDRRDLVASRRRGPGRASRPRSYAA